MENSKDQKVYQKWYYENVTKPKRDALNPDRVRRSPKRDLGEETTRKCENPACDKEFKSKFPERKHCSISCGIRHAFDIKYGIERKPGKDYCPSCKQVYPVSRFPVNKASSKGRAVYCRDCQNEKVRLQNKAGYEENPARFLDAQKRYHQHKKEATKTE